MNCQHICFWISHPNFPQKTKRALFYILFLNIILYKSGNGQIPLTFLYLWNSFMVPCDEWHRMLRLSRKCIFVISIVLLISFNWRSLGTGTFPHLSPAFTAHYLVGGHVLCSATHSPPFCCLATTGQQATFLSPSSIFVFTQLLVVDHRSSPLKFLSWHELLRALCV